MVARNFYLDQLIEKMNNGLIKIITGLRRSGKSFLLFEIFKNYLLNSGINDEHIVCIQLDRMSFNKLHNPEELSKYVHSKILDKEQYYLFIDEIQLCQEFVPVLNDFLYEKNIDIYVTGSNSKFLSKDIITEFRGRGDEIHVNPLSFKEFYQGRDDFDNAWKDYYTFGGMPLVLSQKSGDNKMKYLKDLFTETYIKDIKERNKIKNDNDLEEILNVISSSIGSLVNPKKLVDTFKSVKKVDVSPNTIKNYLEFLEDAFLIQKVMRYDIKGKKYINTPYKYYFTDVGLRNARLNFRQIEPTHLMENVIFNELIIRGYSVDIGVVEISEKSENKYYVRKQLECDFIINKADKKYYIQSVYNIDDPDKQLVEKKSLININDSFKKIIIVRDDIKANRDEKGILTIGLKEFLLNENSIDL